MSRKALSFCCASTVFLLRQCLSVRFCCHRNLSRAIGDQEYKKDLSIPPSAQIISAEPDITVETLGGDDEFLVLACDGACQ
eukprot:SAG22_NODE_9235_length_601_cov_1.366534_2_plen_81_part_00